MKKEILLLTLLCILSGWLNGQNSVDPFEEAASISKTHRFGIHVSPLAVINRRPRVRAGVFVNFRTSSAVLDVEYGKGFVNPIFKNLRLSDIFIGVRPEYRYHLPQTLNQHKVTRFGYVGFEFPVTLSELDVRFVTYPSGGKRFDIDSGTQRRLRISGIFKTGYQLALGRIFYLDMYAGVGYGMRRISYVNVVNKVETFDPPDEEWGLSSDDLAEGEKSVLELALGFRIGIAL